jgi:hypothetical protein
LEAFAGGGVEVDGIAIRFPDSGKPHGTRAVKAEHQAAWGLSANENSLADGKGARFKAFMLAQGLMDVEAQFGEVHEPLESLHH